MCGSDAVPQNNASISDKKSSLSKNVVPRTLWKVGLDPGAMKSLPGVGFW